MTSKYIKFDAGLRRLLGCAHWEGDAYFRVASTRLTRRNAKDKIQRVSDMLLTMNLIDPPSCGFHGRALRGGKRSRGAQDVTGRRYIYRYADDIACCHGFRATRNLVEYRRRNFS